MTPVQKRVLRFMEQHDGTVHIYSGYKLVQFTRKESQHHPAVAGNLCLLHGLTTQKLVEPLGEHRYRLTSLAREKLSRMRK